MSEIKYLEAAEQDIPQIIELWKEFIDFHKIRDPFFTRSKEGPENFGKFILENMRKEDAVVYIAETNGDVIAHILASIERYPPAFEIERYGFVNDLAVSARYRRSGIGTHLFKMVKDWFERKGMNRIEIGVALTNEVSTSFWKKMAFKPYMNKCFMEI